jgi:HEAT repeats
MSRAFWVLLVAIGALSIAVRAQQPQDFSSLYVQLNQTSTTDRAAKQILEAARQDPTVRQQAAEKLPEMIDKPEINEVWLNAVRLAGKLKATEAVPSLQKAFLLGKLDIGRPVAMTFGTEVVLGDDAVARALAEIGDPSLQAVRGFLKNDDPKMRRRAVLILTNINSPASRSLLEEHLPNETDTRLKDWIESWQERNRQ